MLVVGRDPECLMTWSSAWIVLPFHRAAGARSQRLSWNRAWGRGSPGARGEGGPRTWSAPGAGRSRAARVGNRVVAGMGGGPSCAPGLVAQLVKNLHAVQEAWVRSLSWEDPLEKEMASHSNILAWKSLMERGAWWAAVHRVAKNRAQLSD